LAARFGADVQFGGRLIRRRRAPGLDGGIDARVVDPEARGQRLKKGDAWPCGELAIAGQYPAGERNAGGFAAAGKQFLPEVKEALGMMGGGAWTLAPALDQRPAAFRNSLQKLAKERGVHRVPLWFERAPLRAPAMDKSTPAGHRHYPSTVPAAQLT